LHISQALTHFTRALHHHHHYHQPPPTTTTNNNNHHHQPTTTNHRQPPPTTTNADTTATATTTRYGFASWSPLARGAVLLLRNPTNIDASVTLTLSKALELSSTEYHAGQTLRFSSVYDSSSAVMALHRVTLADGNDSKTRVNATPVCNTANKNNDCPLLVDRELTFRLGPLDVVLLQSTAQDTFK
jgi:hypothetical protein